MVSAIVLNIFRLYSSNLSLYSLIPTLIDSFIHCLCIYSLIQFICEYPPLVQTNESTQYLSVVYNFFHLVTINIEAFVVNKPP